MAAADMLYGSRDQWINIEVERPANMEIPIMVAHERLLEQSHKRYVEAKVAGMDPESVVE